MRLNKFGYYGDFVVYPLMIALLAALAARIGPLLEIEWMASLIGGVALWSLAEYLIHRLILHRPGVFMRMHQAHHVAPRERIGTPWWISVATLCLAVGLPAWLGGGRNFASGLTAGVMLGYWWYGIVHHVIHHRTPTPFAGYMHALRLHHLRHHHDSAQCNFGVTSRLWDRLLKTRVEVARPPSRRDPCR